MEVMRSMPPKLDQYKPFATSSTRESFVCILRSGFSLFARNLPAYRWVKIYGTPYCIWQYLCIICLPYIRTCFFAPLLLHRDIQLASFIVKAFSIFTFSARSSPVLSALPRNLQGRPLRPRRFQGTHVQCPRTTSLRQNTHWRAWSHRHRSHNVVHIVQAHCTPVYGSRDMFCCCQWTL